MSNTQTILGSGGAIGAPLAAELKKYTDAIRLVSRKPERVNPDDELLAADLSQSSELDKAVAGSATVYVTIGFPYSYKAWQKLWPPFMENLIEACSKYDARLVFFDNMYMYDPAYLGNMTENTPFGPVSKKGRVRAAVVQQIMEAVERGRIKALIARSADFYGPGITQNSMLNELVIKNLSKGKKANWLGPLEYRHSFTYTPDAAKATAVLGNTAEAYDQTWHLPTAEDPPTADRWVAMTAELLKAQPRCQTLPPWLVSAIGIFVPVLKEIREMMYQYQRDYVFSSAKFNRLFEFTTTSYRDGLGEVIKSDYPTH